MRGARRGHEAATLVLGIARVSAGGGVNVNDYGTYFATPAPDGYMALYDRDTMTGTAPPAAFMAPLVP